MTKNDRIKSFALLGEFLGQFGVNPQKGTGEIIRMLNEQFHASLSQRIASLHIYNGWFTEQNVRSALEAISGSLQKENIVKWLTRYDIATDKPKTVAVIMAGNIPAVGFHDFLCVLMSGNHFLGKLSSQDKHLLPFLGNVLCAIHPGWKERIRFTEGMLENMDAVIATGSDNSSRYFDYYFGKYPHVIRKNRNSVAVLSGRESPDELARLGDDIFMYFGLGCRNVSKLVVPAGYDFNSFFDAIYPYKDVVNNNKYANNYEYNRTLYLMNSTALLDNNFLLLKEDKSLSSPVGVLHYEQYTNLDELKKQLKKDAATIQCIVANPSFFEKAIPFGGSQQPELWYYADGVDTMEFLLGLE